MDTEAIPIKCPACGMLFGIQVGNALNIKNRDLFRRIEGSVSGPCRRCGTTVTWPQRVEK